MEPRDPPFAVLLTQRALSDIRNIEAYSIERWDETVAKRYLGELQSALLRCSHSPGLLRTRLEFSPHLHFYVVNHHLLVCDLGKTEIVVLTVAHAMLDLVSRLSILVPILQDEVEILRRRVERQDEWSPDESDFAFLGRFSSGAGGDGEERASVGVLRWIVEL